MFDMESTKKSYYKILKNLEHRPLTRDECRTLNGFIESIDEYEAEIKQVARDKASGDLFRSIQKFRADIEEKTLTAANKNYGPSLGPLINELERRQNAAEAAKALQAKRGHAADFKHKAEIKQVARDKASGDLFRSIQKFRADIEEKTLTAANKNYGPFLGPLINELERRQNAAEAAKALQAKRGHAADFKHKAGGGFYGE